MHAKKRTTQRAVAPPNQRSPLSLLMVLCCNHEFDICVYEIERLYYIHAPHAFSHWIFRHKPRLAGIPSYAHQFALLNVHFQSNFFFFFLSTCDGAAVRACVSLPSQRAVSDPPIK